MKLIIEVNLKDGQLCRGCTYDLVSEMMRAMKDADENIKAYKHFPFAHPLFENELDFDERGLALLMESKPPISVGELTAEEVEALPIVSRVFVSKEEFDTSRLTKDGECETVAYDREAGGNIKMDEVLAKSERSN